MIEEAAREIVIDWSDMLVSVEEHNSQLQRAIAVMPVVKGRFTKECPF
jgi:hypothetical protein